MTEKKLKISEGTIARLVGDVHSLSQLVASQARTIAMLEARLAVCESRRPGTGVDRILSEFGPRRDAGEQANL